MPGLRDIAPLKIKLTVEGVALEFKGLSVDDIFALTERFEAFRSLVESGSEGLKEKLRDSPALLREFPSAVFAGMAISTGEPGNVEAEKAAAEQGLSVQLDMLDAMMQATFREGVGPFVEKMTEMMSRTRTIKKPSTREASAKRSQPPSAAAFHVDLPPERLGRIRLAS